MTDEDLPALLARLGLASYTTLLVDDEELTTPLLRTMEPPVALESRRSPRTIRRGVDAVRNRADRAPRRGFSGAPHVRCSRVLA